MEGKRRKKEREEIKGRRKGEKEREIAKGREEEEVGTPARCQKAAVVTRDRRRLG